MSKKINRNEHELSEGELGAFIESLKHIGYLLPTTDEESSQFDKIHKSHQSTFPEQLNNDSFLFQKERVLRFASNKAVKKEENDYFKKVVLAAHIVQKLHNEPTFGRIKFVKILYLCEHVCNMHLTTQYKRHAAGPFDPKLFYSVKREFKTQKWFDIVQRDKFGYEFKPLENVEAYKRYYDHYFGRQTEQINLLIELFRKKNTNDCEIVATVYAIWEELLENKALINDATLLNNFYKWSEEKNRFSKAKIESNLRWMENNNIYPSF